MASVVNTFLKNALKTQRFATQKRFYPRWNHRRPLKVYSSEEYDEIEKKNTGEPPEKTLFDKYRGLKTTWSHPKESANPIKFAIMQNKPLIATYQKSKTKQTTDMLETVIDKDGNFVYTKMKNNDPRIGSILTEIKSKKEKEKRDLILLEGKRLIKDALQSGCNLKYILFSRMDEVEYLRSFLPKSGAQLYKMPYRELQMWSDLTTTPGIMAIFKTPNTENIVPQNPLPLTIICDNIRDPGNLGSILRICAAVGCERVLLTKGCVHLWDTKVLRGSVGAHFKLQIHSNLTWQQVSEKLPPKSSFFIADLVSQKEAIPILPYYGVDFRKSEHIVLVVGGETHGVSVESYELAVRSEGALLNIPLSNEIDSLNAGAALGIISFEIKRQLAQCK